MTSALAANDLGKRYRSAWALRDCAFALPESRVAALVGPNGAGKTTLLHLSAGLLEPSAGTVHVFGQPPRERAKEVLPLLGFVAQDHPLYRGFTVAEMLTLGRKLNPRWDDVAARKRLQRLGIPLDRRTGKLSGGQQAQLALTLALAKRPRLVLLDEPLASLDPLARREFLRALMEATEEEGVTVLLSSHILSDLERVCDYLIILSASRVVLAGDITDIRGSHRRLTVPRGEVAAVASSYAVVEQTHMGHETALLVRTAIPATGDHAWQMEEPTLEEIVLAYLGMAPEDAAGQATAPALDAPQLTPKEITR